MPERGFTRVADIGNSVAADFDNDGWIDLFSWSQLRLFRNNGGNSFVEVNLPELLQVRLSRRLLGRLSTEMAFVDLFVGGFEDWDAGITWPFMILINDGGRTFHIARAKPSIALAASRPAILIRMVTSTFTSPTIVFSLISCGSTMEKAILKTSLPRRGAVATSPGFDGGHSIGAAWGDFNNDGLLDLFAGNFAHGDQRGDQPKSRFLKNLGPSEDYKFEDVGTCGIDYQESYATPSAGDYDNDGSLDLFFTTVYAVASFNRNNYPVLLRNNGEFAVTDVTGAAGLANLGPTSQAAWADYDNDGDLDLLSAGRLFQNQGSENSWLKVRLEGDGKLVNRSAIGAQVRITLGEHGEKTLTRQVDAGTGEGNQNDLTLHFGLGQHKAPVSLQVFWPNKTQQTLTHVEINRLVTIHFSASP